MKKETMTRLINEYQGEDLGGYLYQAIEHDKALLKEARNIKSMQAEAETKHKGELKHLRDKWCDLQSRCPHHETTFYPDPSGNNDSKTVCDVCEKSL